jgi:hypothetical protein
MNKPILLAFFILLSLSFQTKAQKTAFTMPEVNKILKGIHLYVAIELDDSTKLRSKFSSVSYLNPLINYIDYNVIGKGLVAVIYEDSLRQYILKNIENGVPLPKIGKALIGEYIREERSVSASVEKEDEFYVGGFFSGEVEYHQEPDGSTSVPIELNQIKLYFASHINSKSKKNNISIFAEYNPVPEEVIHQIDQAIITKGSFMDTLRQIAPTESGGETIPFERLFVHIKNVGGTPFNLTFGQFRNPFGIWSDYSSHRNFTTTKNNVLVNGFALKKIEMGLKVDFKIKNNWEVEAAIVNGRFGRTSSLLREDTDNKKDFVTHITYTNNRLTMGASAYLAEFAFDKRTAYGVDFGYRFDKLLLSGELVLQQNKQLPLTATNISPFISELSSQSGYLQFDYELNHKLHVYGLYDYWKMKADGKTVNQAAYKIFHGLKYFINPKARWTIIEYGHIGHKGFDKGSTHLSTQLEINF